MDAKFSFETKEIDSIIDESKEILSICKKKNIPEDDEERLDKLHSFLFNKYNNFARSYPITLKMMIYEKRFNVKVFKNWLESIKGHDWSNENQFFEDQANYVVSLYINYNKKHTAQTLRTIKEKTIELLKEEKKNVKSQIEKYSKEFDEKDKEIEIERKRKWIESLKNIDVDELSIEEQKKLYEILSELKNNKNNKNNNIAENK